jgi:predicted  nucleic acid-binding Zn-ribbon protein
MEASAVARSRLLGAILVENDLITQEQLDRALQLQEESGDRLGEIVIAQFGVSRLDLASVLAEQWAVVRQASVTPAAPSRSSHQGPLRPPQPELPTGAEARPRGRLGEIFVERGIITGDQLDDALHAQRTSGERIGNILIERGVISRLDLADALAEQWAQLQMVRGPASASFPTPVFGGAIPAEPSTNRRPLDEIEQRLESLEHTVAESTGETKLDDEIRSRLSALEKRATTIGSEPPAPALVATVDELRARVDGLMAESAGGMVELRREVEALRSDRADGVSELRATVASLTAGAEERDAAADDRAGHLDRDLGELNARVQELAETATRLQNDTKTAVDRLTDRLQSENERLIRLETSLTDHASQIEERLEQESERLAIRLPDNDKLEALTRVTDELAERTDGLSARTADLGAQAATRDGLTDLARRIDELSSRLLDAHDVADTLEELHARIDSSAAESAAVSERMAGLRTELDNRLAEIATRQERQAHATASSVAAAREEIAALMRAAAERSSLHAKTRSDPAKRTKSPKGKRGKKKRT